MVEAIARTEWTICIVKIIEGIFCLVCMLLHIKAVFYKEEPIPHNVLFCAIFGGYFILSLAGIFVPISGQKSPPGVDFVFSASAFLFFFVAACVSMYYANVDPHLENMSDKQEAEHPFFIHCKEHCTWSLITGTMFLLHAAISADRLYYAKLGVSSQDEIRHRTEVDLPKDAKIQLHIFVLDWIIHFWNWKCTQLIVSRFRGCCKRINSCCNSCAFWRRRRRRRRRRRHHNSNVRSNVALRTVRTDNATAAGNNPSNNPNNNDDTEGPIVLNDDQERNRAPSYRFLFF